MRFWDTSALVPLLVAQPASKAVRRLYQGDSDVLAWTLSDMEATSAIMRLAREGRIALDQVPTVLAELEALWQGVQACSAIDMVKTRGRRVLRTHALAAADALQLGAALALVHDDPRGREFVCLDHQLRNAAETEGFSVLPKKP